MIESNVLKWKYFAIFSIIALYIFALSLCSAIFVPFLASHKPSLAPFSAGSAPKF